jgi:hypothetical protein
MSRYKLVVVVAGGLVLGAVAGALAESRSSTLRVLAENPKARFNPRVQVLLVEERLTRPEPVEIYPPYLTYQEGSAGVDQQIRRLGELIRRHERE